MLANGRKLKEILCARLVFFLQGVLGGSEVQLRQMFERFVSPLPAEDAEARLQHFKARVWPRIRDSGSGGDARTCVVDQILVTL